MNKLQKNILIAIMLGLIFFTLSGNQVYAQDRGYSLVIKKPDIQHQIVPPATPIRQPAEFEPMQGVLIRYPFGISYQIIAEMSEDVEVVTIVASSSQQSYVETQYQNNGVNLNHCSFLIASSDVSVSFHPSFLILLASSWNLGTSPFQPLLPPV